MSFRAAKCSAREAEAPPKLDAKFEDHALYQIKNSVLKARCVICVTRAVLRDPSGVAGLADGVVDVVLVWVAICWLVDCF